ncbi:MAG: GWxTD domain-containing protein, partial [bacterium]
YDKDTRNKGSKKIKLDFSKKDKTPILLEPIVVTNLEGNWGFNDGEFPLTGKRITNIDDGLTLIISGFVDKGQYQVEMFLDGKNEENRVIVIENDETPDGYFITRYKLKKDDLSTLGLNLKLIIKQNGKERSLFKNISIFKPGLSGFINNVENSFQQMKYILTNDERKKAKGKKGKELESLFLSFWKERDPTPNTSINELMEEYYIRVNYVNEYFNMSWREGWETDFGMIYILFGPPDQIERSNSTSTSSSIYQVWYYSRLNKQFVFKDQNGFGDFKLDRPFIGQNF